MSKRNYNYGKIENGSLTYAPNMLIFSKIDENGNEQKVQMFNASTYLYAQQGWLPITRTDMPEQQEGGYWSPTYAEVAGQIVQSWQFIDYPEVIGLD